MPFGALDLINWSGLFCSDFEKAAWVVREWVHVLFCVVLAAVHTEGHLTRFAVIVIALLGLLNDPITRGAHLVDDHWVERHRTEDFL